MKKIFFSSLLIFLCSFISAQRYIKPSSNLSTRSFAIITDTKTWKYCKKELIAYQQVLETEQLPTFILYDNWQCPEDVKEEILKLYAKKNLEGVVFVGDIPIPMIRKAQHLTSAFKMDEKRFPWNKSSVPSDRFYDDFSLKFNFLRRDSSRHEFFYYDLAVESPQKIHCDIYSGRIKPIANGDNPYKQISDYLRKVVEEHKVANRLDNFFSYTGEGSYSNSLTAWTAEAFTLREQFPKVFDVDGRARFMRYDMLDYPKNCVMNMLKREEIDLAVFHNHGIVHRQYLVDEPTTSDFSEHLDRIKYDGRSYLRRCKGELKKINDFYDKRRQLGLDSTWFSNYNEPEQRERDSLQHLKTVIELSDVTKMQPNARMIIFDACYNGDFREDDYIAGRYIFNSGKTVVTFGNTVNVLQDKMSNEMLGLLGLGARVGQWAMLTNYLESHIVGDPTFRFSSLDSDVDASSLLSTPYNEIQALAYLESPYMDIRNMAMCLLYHHKYQGISDLLKNKYLSAPLWMERYTALSLLEKIGDKNFDDILKKSIYDPYEFIRRSTVNWMGDVGRNDYLPLIIREYSENYFSERERFDICSTLQVFDSDTLVAAINDILPMLNVADKEGVRKTLLAENERMKSINNSIFDASDSLVHRRSMIYILRNINMHPFVAEYIKILRASAECDDVKIAMLQALAWFRHSVNRQQILDVCMLLMKDDNVSIAVKDEAARTYYRLK